MGRCNRFQVATDVSAVGFVYKKPSVGATSLLVKRVLVNCWPDLGIGLKKMPQPKPGH